MVSPAMSQAPTGSLPCCLFPGPPPGPKYRPTPPQFADDLRLGPLRHSSRPTPRGEPQGLRLIPAKFGQKLLRYNQPEGSVIVFAPQGAGKGVGIVIPNLLDYRGSIICTDPKGENYAVTARRRSEFGPVWRLNLADPTASHSFNPLDIIIPGSPTALDDAKVLADLMLPHDNGNEAIALSAQPMWKPEVAMPGNPRWFSPPLYGLKTYGDLFTPRQLIALTTFSDLVTETQERIRKDALAAGMDADDTGLDGGGTGAKAYAEAVGVYLGLGVSRLADAQNSVCFMGTRSRSDTALVSSSSHPDGLGLCGIERVFRSGRRFCDQPW